MTIRITRKKSFFSNDTIELLTDDELSKLKVSINPLSHDMSANGKTIRSGTTSSIDLKKIYNYYGMGGIEILDTRTSAIQVASFPRISDGFETNTLCDFIITVEDRGRITPGLSLSGGFQDGF